MRRSPGTARIDSLTLSILLHDMGFDVDDDILFRLDGVNVTISKIVPTPDRRQSVDERRRFN